MSLIPCKECGKEFSDTADACPDCAWTPINDAEFLVELAEATAEAHNHEMAVRGALRAVQLDPDLSRGHLLIVLSGTIAKIDYQVILRHYNILKSQSPELSAVADSFFESIQAGLEKKREAKMGWFSKIFG